MLSRKLAVFGSVAALSVAAAPIAAAATVTTHSGSHHTHRLDRSRDPRGSRLHERSSDPRTSRLHDRTSDPRSVDLSQDR